MNAALDFVQATWLGPPLRYLDGESFPSACAQLMRLVEADYVPTLIVGVRTGGLVVARAMADAARSEVPVLPLTCRRGSTHAKARLPLVRTLFAALPLSVADLLRRLEHRVLIAARRHQGRQPLVDRMEAETIARHLARTGGEARVVVADDAVDSGVTLATVVALLHAVCPAGTEFRSAVITQTLDDPKLQPDYVLYRGLHRFPWSFDAKR